MEASAIPRCFLGASFTPFVASDSDLRHDLSRMAWRLVPAPHRLLLRTLPYAGDFATPALHVLVLGPWGLPVRRRHLPVYAQLWGPPCPPATAIWRRS